mmetsp:Transcript_16958/g.41810  ORF Transcript_16958/g.41810 Transcript_16958/m.41810 type:complete len:255 (-) Transcript_16958:333-1097(-)
MMLARRCSKTFSPRRTWTTSSRRMRTIPLYLKRQQRRAVRRYAPEATATAAAAAGVAIPAVASSAAKVTIPELACAASFLYLVGSFITFWVAARSSNGAVYRQNETPSSAFSSASSWAVQFTKSHLPLVPLCVLYLALLVASWSPDTLSLIMPGSIEEGLADGFKMQFVPRLDGIMELLSRRTTAASAWLHIACINFFVGRHAALRAMTQGLPVAHTLALTLVTGPLGLFSHWITQAVVRGGGGGVGGNGSTAE